MDRGLDRNFINYGIRQEDLGVIEKLCDEKGVSYEWLRDWVLGKYHERYNADTEVSDDDARVVLQNALKHIKEE